MAIPAEIAALSTAVKAERLRRITGGAVTQGNKNGRSYSVELMSEAELSNLENALARKLGVQGANKRRMNFSNGGSA